MRPNLIFAAWRAGKTALGAAVQINSPWLVEMCAAAGFDYVLLDCEHGAAGNGLPELIMAAEAAGVTPIVRTPDHGRASILPALEAGAGGIWAPMVESAEQARQLVDEVKYAPVGRRGFSLATRAARYGSLTREEHVSGANRETLLAVTIETTAGVEQAGQIAQVPGIDLLFVGRDDLAESLGARDRNDNAVDLALQRVSDAARGRIPVGTTAFAANDVVRWSPTPALFLTGTTGTIARALAAAYRTLATGQ